MKILHTVESYYPSTGGMQEVVRQLSERMAAQGVDVTVATSRHPDRDFSERNGVKILDFAISGNLVNGISGEKEKYEQLLLSNSFDVIVFFAAQQWATDLALPLLNRIRAKKISVPTGYSGLYWKEYAGYFEQMKTWIHGYDMNVFLSDDYRDIHFARSNGVKNCMIIPNGAAAEEFEAPQTLHVRKDLNIPQDHFLILHVGSYTGIKGHKEALDIFYGSDIRHSTLLMIGNNSEAFKGQYRFSPRHVLRKLWAGLFKDQRVQIGFFSREFTVAAFRQADLFLFPSNVECSPIVLFESAAAGLPFLSTAAGNSKEIAEWTGGGEIMTTLEDGNGLVFADIPAAVKQLNALYKDKARLRQLGQQGHSSWKQKFTWEKLSQDYLHLYRQLTQQL